MPEGSLVMQLRLIVLFGVCFVSGVRCAAAECFVADQFIAKAKIFVAAALAQPDLSADADKQTNFVNFSTALFTLENAFRADCADLTNTSLEAYIDAVIHFAKASEFIARDRMGDQAAAHVNLATEAACMTAEYMRNGDIHGASAAAIRFTEAFDPIAAEIEEKNADSDSAI